MCTPCKLKGSLIKNGKTKVYGRVLKCNLCARQFLGFRVIELLNVRVGDDRCPRQKPQVENPTATEGKAAEVDNGMNTYPEHRPDNAYHIPAPTLSMIMKKWKS